MSDNLYKDGTLKNFPKCCKECFYFDAFFRVDCPLGIAPPVRDVEKHKIITTRWINACRFTIELKKIINPDIIAGHCRLLEEDE